MQVASGIARFQMCDGLAYKILRVGWKLPASVPDQRSPAYEWRTFVHDRQNLDVKAPRIRDRRNDRDSLANRCKRNQCPWLMVFKYDPRTYLSCLTGCLQHNAACAARWRRKQPLANEILNCKEFRFRKRVPGWQRGDQVRRKGFAAYEKLTPACRVTAISISAFSTDSNSPLAPSAGTEVSVPRSAPGR